MTTTQDYEIGYKKPPKAYQWKPGDSGNKAGRKKGSRSISQAVVAALKERVPVVKNGRHGTISKWEAACIQMANQAAGGNPKAAKMMIDILHQAEAHEGARADGVEVAAEERRALDKAVLAALRESILVDQTEG